MYHSCQPGHQIYRATCVSRYQKGKPVWILMRQEKVLGQQWHWPHHNPVRQLHQITLYHSIFIGQILLKLKTTSLAPFMVTCVLNIYFLLLYWNSNAEKT